VIFYTDLTERGDLLQWWRYMHSTPGTRGLVERGVRTFALAWILGADEPGFHVVLENGDVFGILPGRRHEIFQIIPQGDLQVSLD
jgi:hypothetical protein